MRKEVPENKHFPRIWGRQQVDTGLVIYIARRQKQPATHPQNRDTHDIQTNPFFPHPSTDLGKAQNLRF